MIFFDYYIPAISFGGSVVPIVILSGAKDLTNNE